MITRPRNLAAAAAELQKHLPSFAQRSGRSPVSSEREFLFQIQERINAILNTLGGWNIDSPHDRFHKKLKENISQAELLTSAEKSTVDTYEFTNIMTKKLLADINNFFETHKDSLGKMNKKDLDVLTEVQECVQFVINDIEEKSSNKHQIVHDFYKRQIDSTEEREAFGISVLPDKQGFDPTVGGAKNKTTQESIEFEGVCWGRTAAYLDLVNKEGIGRAIPRLDTTTLETQRTAIAAFATAEKSHDSQEYYRWSNTIFSIVDNLIPTSSDLTYILSVMPPHSQKNESGHSMAIRKIPKENSIEFYDSNLGIMVCENPEKFKDFFIAFIHMKYFPQGGEYTLHEGDPQNKKAIASLPVIHETNTENFFNKNITHILKQDISKYLKKYNSATHDTEEIAAIDNLDVAFRFCTNVRLKYVSDEKEIKQAHDILIDFQIKRFEAMRQILPKPTVTDSEIKEDLSLIPAKIKEDHERLQSKVIEQLSALWAKKSNNARENTALDDLISSIKESPPAKTLAIIIQQWKKSHRGDLDNKALRKSINSLAESHETSAFRMEILREGVLRRLMGLVLSLKWPGEDPSLNQTMKKDLTQLLMKHSSSKDVLHSFIQHIPEYVAPVSPKSSSISTGNIHNMLNKNSVAKVFEDFKKIFNAIDLEDPTKLYQAADQLNNIYQKRLAVLTEKDSTKKQDNKPSSLFIDTAPAVPIVVQTVPSPSTSPTTPTESRVSPMQKK